MLENIAERLKILQSTFYLVACFRLMEHSIKNLDPKYFLRDSSTDIDIKGDLIFDCYAFHGTLYFNHWMFRCKHVIKKGSIFSGFGKDFYYVIFYSFLLLCSERVHRDIERT